MCVTFYKLINYFLRYLLNVLTNPNKEINSCKNTEREKMYITTKCFVKNVTTNRKQITAYGKGAISSDSTSKFKYDIHIVSFQD